eukprot:134581-Chlamydomonas_euryale.AAC.1
MQCQVTSWPQGHSTPAYFAATPNEKSSDPSMISAFCTALIQHVRRGAPGGRRSDTCAGLNEAVQFR